MSHGKAHARFNFIFLLPIFVGLSLYIITTSYIFYICFVLAYVYATLYANPDMDLANQIKLFSFRGVMALPYRIFYAPFFKHRSSVSHSLLWGTPSRLACLALFLVSIVFLLLFLKQLFIASVSARDLPTIAAATLSSAWEASKFILQLCLENRLAFAAFIAGFYLADFGHILLDKLVKR